VRKIRISRPPLRLINFFFSNSSGRSKGGFGGPRKIVWFLCVFALSKRGQLFFKISSVSPPPFGLVVGAAESKGQFSLWSMVWRRPFVPRVRCPLPPHMGVGVVCGFSPVRVVFSPPWFFLLFFPNFPAVPERSFCPGKRGLPFRRPLGLTC